MDGIGEDLKLALRLFRRSPGFAAIVVLTLALGSGANTAIFTLLDQVMLRPLPVERPERLVILHAPGQFSGWSSSLSSTIQPLSQPIFEGLRDRTRAFSGVLAHYWSDFHLTVDGRTENVHGDLVSGGFFQVLGVRAAYGRLFTADDDRTRGRHPVAVIGYRLFERRFGGDPRVVGRRVSVNGQPMTVVGVAPRGFEGIELGTAVDVYVPLSMQNEVQPTWTNRLGEWRSRWLVCLARLADGASREAAAAEANVVYAQLLQEDWAHLPGGSESLKARFLAKKLELLPGARGTSDVRDQSGTPLLVLMGMVGLVLLIACANVASLLLTRASARQKELALRLALGAGRARIVRLYLVESLTLALAGGLVGLQLAYWLGDALIRALPFESASATLTAVPDWRVGIFTLALSVLSGVGFGLAPALRSSQTDLAPVLKSEAASVVGGSGHFRLRKGLVVAQVALSLLLLVGAGLFARSLMNLRALDPGFRPERLVAFSVDPAMNGLAYPARAVTLRRIQEELAAVPGVVSVSAAEVALFTNSSTGNTLRIEGYEAKEGEEMNSSFNYVAPGFFDTLGIPLVAGRDLAASDAAGAPRVAIVNESFARRFYGELNPIGRRFGLRGEGQGYDYEIVGLVRDGKASTMREAPRRFVYVPYAQEASVGGLTYYVRSSNLSDSLGAQLTAAVARVDPTLPVTGLKTMQEQIGESLFVDRMVAALSAAFGLLATLLAAVGLYGVMSYAVAVRTREIGLRVALGADRRSVLLLVLREVAVLAGLGVAIGLPFGYGIARALESQLFGLRGHDPLTFAGAVLLLVTTALVAGLAPALRAARVDPMTALRYQ